jgi:hypothetical protein
MARFFNSGKLERGVSVGQPQQMLLNQFGDLVQDAFGTSNVYHVGSSMGANKKDWRDVDVRVLLEPEEWKALGLLEPGENLCNTHSDPKWRALCIVFAHYGRHLTGLPIDFQLQRLPEANALYSSKDGHCRSWMGTINATHGA